MDLSPGQLDTLFQALGDTTRRKMIARLASGPATVSELAAPFDMALPSFMDHVRRLENAGMVETRKTGRVRMVSLRTDAFSPVRTWLDDQREIWEARMDRMEAFVSNSETQPPEEEQK